jgi:hypothetical protein
MIIHIALAVEDLEAAKTTYARSLGIEWGPTMTLTDTLDPAASYASVSDVPGLDIEVDGLMAANALNLEKSGDPFAGIAPLELIHARPGSGSSGYWGCPDGTHYIHHIAFGVDDYERESAHLVASGFAREWRFDRNDTTLFGYFKSPTSFRIELMQL